MYVCGPTVYSDIHLGNARSIIIFDMIHRYFLYLGYHVKYLHNITDIDDKIINKSIANKIPELELSNKYYLEYLKILKSANILLPTKIFKVSDKISSIISFIDNLLANKSAYLAKDGIYFDTTKIKNYGNNLSNQNTNLLKTSIKNNVATKKNESDFALWKFTTIGLNWEFPKGKFGRPGWHTECVTLINEFFNCPIDIHGGGVDLKFPHHENELAQQYAYNGKKLANFWIHNGHLNIKDTKMSKSLNNVVLAKDFLDAYGSDVLRYLFCLSSYQGILNLNEAIMSQAIKEVNKIQKLYVNYDKYFGKTEVIDNDEYILKFVQEMNNNFNFPNVLTIISNLIKIINIETSKNNRKSAGRYFQILDKILEILGFNFNIS